MSCGRVSWAGAAAAMRRTETMPTDAQRRAASARQRRWRARQACGFRVFRLALDEDRAALAILNAGLLTETELQDHERVERALEILVKKKIL